MVFPRHILKDRGIREPVVGMELGHGIKQLSGGCGEDPTCLTTLGPGRHAEGHPSGSHCGQNQCNSREKGSSLSIFT